VQQGPHQEKGDSSGLRRAQLFVVGFVSYLRFLSLFAHSGVQHIVRCLFVLLFFVVLPELRITQGFSISSSHNAFLVIGVRITRGSGLYTVQLISN
jgi:hypothetical protein